MGNVWEGGMPCDNSCETRRGYKPHATFQHQHLCIGKLTSAAGAQQYCTGVDAHKTVTLEATYPANKAQEAALQGRPLVCVPALSTAVGAQRMRYKVDQSVRSMFHGDATEKK